MLSLREWSATLPVHPYTGEPNSQVGIGMFVKSGVPRKDLSTYWAALYPGDRVTPFAAHSMCQDLLLLAVRWPGLTLRAGVGWVIVGAALCGTDEAQMLDLVGVWDEEGMGQVGWLFEAAGLGLVEGAAVVAADDPDRWDAVRLLAGLAGVPLPG